MSNELKKLVIDITTGEQTLVDLTPKEISQMNVDHNTFLELRNNYVTKRLHEYPSIGDQLDALFHAGVFPEEMAAQIQAVKDKYPKE